MKFIKTYQYSQSVDEIAAAYLDEDFLTAKFDAINSRNVSVSVEAYEDDTFAVNVDREVPADVPGPLKTFVKPWNKTSQRESWTGREGGPYTATVIAKPDAAPAEIASTVTITATDTGCETVTEFDIVCNVPLVGKKLAKFIGEAAAESLDDEYNFLTEHA